MDQLLGAVGVALFDRDHDLAQLLELFGKRIKPTLGLRIVVRIAKAGSR